MFFYTNICSLLVLLCSSWVSSMPPRQQQQQPFPVSIKVMDERPYKYGRVLNVECIVADSQDGYEMKWVREGASARANFYASYNRILMEIKSMIPMDFGKYTCEATRRDGVVSRNRITFKRDRDSGSGFIYEIDHSVAVVVPVVRPIVEEPSAESKEQQESGEKNKGVIGNINNDRTIRIIEEFQTYTHEGETVKFTCEVDGIANDKIRWEKNMAQLPQNHEIHGNVLILKEVQPEDTGYYICSFEERSASVFLGIANKDDPITIVRIRRDKKLVNAFEGERVKLECVVVGELPTRVWWKKHESEQRLEDNVLILDRVSVADFGYYECFGENELGLFSDFIYLDIEERPKEAFSVSEKQQRDENQHDQENEYQYDEDHREEQSEYQDDADQNEESHNEEQPEEQDEDQDQEDQGQEDQGQEDQGQEDQDQEDQGQEDQGQEDQGEEDQIKDSYYVDDVDDELEEEEVKEEEEEIVKDDDGLNETADEVDYIGESELKNKNQKDEWQGSLAGETTGESLSGGIGEGVTGEATEEVTGEVLISEEPERTESYVEDSSDAEMMNVL